MSRLFLCLVLAFSVQVNGLTNPKSEKIGVRSWLESPSTDTLPAINTIEDASVLLQEWDKSYNPDTVGEENQDILKLRKFLPTAVRLLSDTATEERQNDSTTGRCMLGICASSAAEGLATLKAWVNELQLPRGLLHGMDKDGVPLELEGGVYIKYNSGKTSFSSWVLATMIAVTHNPCFRWRIHIC